MGGHVTLVRVDNTVSDILLRELDQELSFQGALREDEMLSVLARDTLDTDAIVLGTRLERPVQFAQQVYSLGKDLPILILSPQERFEQLRHAVQFSPFLGSETRPWPASDVEELALELRECVTRTQQRRRYRGAMAAVQARLNGAPPARPQVSHYLDSLLDRAPIGVLNLDPHGRILTLNRRAAAILQRAGQAIAGTNFPNLFVSPERERIDTMLRQCVPPSRERAPMVVEIPGLERSYAEMTAAALVDPTGELVTTVILQDVTEHVRAEGERKRVEQDLLASERRYRELLLTMNEAVAVLDERYAITYVNRRFCEKFGYRQDEILGRALIDFVHEDDRDLVSSYMNTVRWGQPVRFENAWITKSGATIHTLTSPKLVFDEKGNHRACLGVFTDITERRQAEEALRQSEKQLRLITEAIPELVGYLDTDGRYQFCNKAFETWFGCSRTEIQNLKVEDVVGAEAYGIIKPNLDVGFGGEAAYFEGTIPYARGGPRYCRASYIPDHGPDGSVRGLFLLVSDISQRKEAEERQRQHLIELCHASRLTTLGELSSQLAHELAQPLASIATHAHACARLMDRGGDMTSIRDSLIDITDQALRAREIMSRLRKLARKDFSRGRLDFNELIDSVLHLTESQARMQNVHVEVELGADLPPLLGDQILIEQALLNLVLNAIDALGGISSAQRRLSVRTCERPEGSVRVEVCDNGPGLNQEVEPRIFEPFFSTKSEGMGMGLAITKSIVDNHGGEIGAENLEPAGTRFWFSIPATD